MSHVRVLSLQGDFDMVRKAWIETELDKITTFPRETIAILDLTKVRYLDTSFLNALARVGNILRADDSHRSVRLVAPLDSFARRLFAISGLDGSFPFFTSQKLARRGVSPILNPAVVPEMSTLP